MKLCGLKTEIIITERNSLSLPLVTRLILLILDDFFRFGFERQEKEKRKYSVTNIYVTPA